MYLLKSTFPMAQSLCGLPQEIRDEILTHVILSKRPLPDHNNDAPNVREARHHGRRGHGWNERVKWELSASGHPALSLLLVSHQIHDEALAVWRRLQCARAIPCYADVLFVPRETELWPTILSAPDAGTDFGTVRAQFRIAGLPDPKNCMPNNPQLRKILFRKCIWAAPEMNMPVVKWMFYELLTSFLEFGPLAQSICETESSRKRRITVKMLELDVRSPEDKNQLASSGVSYRDWHSARTWRMGQDESHPTEQRIQLLNAQMRPEWLVTHLRDNLSYILAMQYSTMTYGAVFYERIGKIRLLLDGDLVQDWDLSEQFATLPEGVHWGNGSAQYRKEWFAKWQPKTARRRKKFLGQAEVAASTAAG